MKEEGYRHDTHLTEYFFTAESAEVAE